MTDATPAASGEEIAAALVAKWLDTQTDTDLQAAFGADEGIGDGNMRRTLVAAVASAIATARQQAGEEAAGIAETHKPVGHDYPARGYEIAAAIRAHFSPVKNV